MWSVCYMSDKVLTEAEFAFDQKSMYCPRYRVSYWSRTQSRVATRSFRLFLDYVFVHNDAVRELDLLLSGLGLRLARSTNVIGRTLEAEDATVDSLMSLEEHGWWDIAPSQTRRQLARGMIGHSVNVATTFGRNVTGTVIGATGGRVRVSVDMLTGILTVDMEKIGVAHV